MTHKSTINLLQTELWPKQPLLTLKRVVLSWLLVIAVMLLGVFFTQYQVHKVMDQVSALNKIKIRQDKVLADLNSQLKKNKTDATLMNKLGTLKFVMANKEALYEQLTNRNTTYVAGFAKAMTDLSNMHSKDISLQRVLIDNTRLLLSGMARTPEAVPAWLALFDSSSVLSGRVFSQFSITANESGLIDFEVSTENMMDIWEEGQ
jgi:hypothetical protein